MKMNNVMLAMALTVGLNSTVFAANDQGHGKINFIGSIVDAPCSISSDTTDQTVNLGQVSNVALQSGGKSTPKYFDIKLENCDLSAEKKNNVTVTFSGLENADKLLDITGTAKGAGIALINSDGSTVTLGEATKTRDFQNGSNSLQFAAYLQGSATGDITPGEFQSVADFTLAYQ